MSLEMHHMAAIMTSIEKEANKKFGDVCLEVRKKNMQEDAKAKQVLDEFEDLLVHTWEPMQNKFIEFSK